MEEESLSSIKYKYDIAKNKLSIFISIVNNMYVISAENRNFELFNNALRDLKLNSLSYVNIERVISNANLFLSEEERIRFFKLCEKEYMSFEEHFNIVCNSHKDAKDLNKQDSVKLEEVYYQNSIGIIDFPLYGGFSREKMIDGIQKQFIRFGCEIMKLDVPDYVICEDIKKYIHNGNRDVIDNLNTENIYHKNDIELKDKQYYELYKNLNNKYVKDISVYDFSYFINHKKLSDGAIIAKWIGKKADAWRFLYWIDKKETETNFNKYFTIYKDGNKRPKLVQSDKKDLQMELDGSIWDVLRRYTK